MYAANLQPQAKKRRASSMTQGPKGADKIATKKPCQAAQAGDALQPKAKRRALMGPLSQSQMLLVEAFAASNTPDVEGDD